MTELIAIGKIVNTHGHLGEMKVLPLTDFPERFAKTKRVSIDLKDQILDYHIESVRYHNRFIILKFKEITDMNMAEKIKGAIIKVPREETVKLPEGHFYVFDIIGLQVYTTDERHLGQVTDVITTGSNDVYVVKMENNKEILIPALKQVVQEININEQKMTVKLLEGLEP